MDQDEYFEVLGNTVLRPFYWSRRPLCLLELCLMVGTCKWPLVSSY